jgi:hypothetical protein
MRSVARRGALPALVVGAVLFASAWLTTEAQAYVFWGYSAPTLSQSGIGRAEQDGSSVSGRTVAISSSDLLQYTYRNSYYLKQFSNDAGVVIDGGYVYWGWYGPTIDGAGIGRAKLGGSDVKGQLISLPGSDQLQGLAVSGNYIYWAWDAPTRSAAGIGRAELNGSHVNNNFISVPSTDNLEGLAANGSYLYWGWKAPTVEASGIGRVDLNGSHMNNSFISISSRYEPAGVAVNGSYLYWGWNGPTIDQSGVGRAKLNGSHADNGFVSLSSRDQPAGVAVDGSYIYWGWYGPTISDSGIGRAKLNGSDVKGQFISVSGRDEIGGLAVGGPPANTSPPTISGTAKQGDKLTEHHGSWLNGVSSYPKYQWRRCNSTGGGCSSISGATHSTYTLSSSDVNYTIRVRETAENASGDSETATSAHTAKVLPLPPTNITPPSISANVSAVFTVGLNLTEVHGSWKGSPTSYKYRWELCNASGGGCNAIPGETGQTYALTDGAGNSTDDVGGTIRVQELATNAGGSSAWATSAQSPLVLPLPPVNVTVPSIAGDLYVYRSPGQTLWAVPGSWTNGPITPSYQWVLCGPTGGNCEAILGATASTYTLIPGQQGDTIELQESATNAGGTSQAATSLLSGQIGTFFADTGGFAPINNLPPVLTGVGGVGDTLQGWSGAWFGSPTLTYTYQWQLCSSSASCTDIPNASGTTTGTNTTYTPTSADAGESVRVVVSAANGIVFSGTNAVASNLVGVSP